MGAWGTRTFEVDLAFDWLNALEQDPSIAFLRAALEVPDGGYLERAPCVGTLAAAEIVAGVLSGPPEWLPEQARSVIDALSRADVESLVAPAGAAVRRVLGDSSLRQIWSENVESFPEWQDGVLDLCRRLDG